MLQHLALHVPWHDSGWNGPLCRNPAQNGACLRRKRVRERRKADLECPLCGACLAGQEQDLPCVDEGAAFLEERLPCGRADGPGRLPCTGSHALRPGDPMGVLAAREI